MGVGVGVGMGMGCVLAVALESPPPPSWRGVAGVVNAGVGWGWRAVCGLNRVSPVVPVGCAFP
jgi:hypothetical protein